MEKPKPPAPAVKLARVQMEPQPLHVEEESPEAAVTPLRQIIDEIENVLEGRSRPTALHTLVEHLTPEDAIQRAAFLHALDRLQQAASLCYSTASGSHIPR